MQVIFLHLFHFNLIRYNCRLIRFIFGWFLILIFFLPGGISAQSFDLESNHKYLWGIDPAILQVTKGSIITDAILKFENLTNQSENLQTFSVHLINNPAFGFEFDQIDSGDTDLSGKKHQIGSINTPADSVDNYSLRFSNINNPDSWCWKVFKKPFKYRLADSKIIDYSSSVLELIDYAGTDSGFGILIECGSNTELSCQSISIELKIESFLDKPSRLFQKITLSAIQPDAAEPDDPSIRTYPYRDGEYLYQSSRLNYGPKLIVPEYKMVVEETPLEVEIKVEDIDDLIINIRTDNLPENAVYSNGVFRWTPSRHQSGEHTVVFIADDGKNTDTSQLKINVISSNTEPVIISDNYIEHHLGQVMSFQIRAEDKDSDRLRYSIENPPAGMMLMGNVIYWNPSENQSGKHELVLSVSDGKSKISEQIVIDVSPANHPPAIDMIPHQTGSVNDTFVFIISASDLDGDPLKYYAENNPPGSVLISNVFMWTPQPDQAGVHFFTVKASDGKDVTSQYVTLTIK